MARTASFGFYVGWLSRLLQTLAFDGPALPLPLEEGSACRVQMGSLAGAEGKATIGQNLTRGTLDPVCLGTKRCTNKTWILGGLLGQCLGGRPQLDEGCVTPSFRASLLSLPAEPT